MLVINRCGTDAECETKDGDVDKISAAWICQDSFVALFPLDTTEVS